MTPRASAAEKAAHQISIINARSNGKVIESRNKPSNNSSPGNIWEEMLPRDEFNFERDDYRVKPEEAGPRKVVVQFFKEGGTHIVSYPPLPFADETITFTELPPGWEVKRIQ